MTIKIEIGWESEVRVIAQGTYINYIRQVALLYPDLAVHTFSTHI